MWSRLAFVREERKTTGWSSLNCDKSITVVVTAVAFGCFRLLLIGSDKRKAYALILQSLLFSVLLLAAIVPNSPLFSPKANSGLFFLSNFTLPAIVTGFIILIVHLLQIWEENPFQIVNNKPFHTDKKGSNFDVKWLCFRFALKRCMLEFAMCSKITKAYWCLVS